MSVRAATSIAWSLWLLVVLFIAASFDSYEIGGDLYLLTHPRSASPEAIGAALVFAVLGPALFLAYATVGAIIASLRPRNDVGWLCMGVGFFAVSSDVVFLLAASMNLSLIVDLQTRLSFVPSWSPCWRSR